MTGKPSPRATNAPLNVQSGSSPRDVNRSTTWSRAHEVPTNATPACQRPRRCISSTNERKWVNGPVGAEERLGTSGRLMDAARHCKRCQLLERNHAGILETHRSLLLNLIHHDRFLLRVRIEPLRCSPSASSARCDLDRNRRGFGPRVEVLVRTPDGPIRAWTYVAASSHVDDTLQPFRWYRDLVAAGTEALGLPSEYTAGIHAVRAEPDPDSVRARRNRSFMPCGRAG